MQRGIHQGCTLATYMFIIIVEALNVAIKNAMRTSPIKCISPPQCNSQQIINQYVDDTSFIVRVEVSMDNLVVVLQNFGIASRLEINWHKSMAY